MEPLDDSPGKAAYLAALASMAKVPPLLDTMAGQLLTAAKLTDAAYRGDKPGGHGGPHERRDTRGQQRAYSTRKKATPRAAKQFTTAQNAYREAAKLDPAAGYDERKEALQSELRLQQAQLSIRMAADGKACQLDTSITPGRDGPSHSESTRFR